MGWLIASILSAIMAIIGFISSAQTKNFSDKFAVVVMFILAIVFMKKYRDSKNGVTASKKAEKLKRIEKSQEKAKVLPGSKERIEYLGAIMKISSKHMSGLTVAEGAHCIIYLCNDKMIFERNETTYNLLFDKIKDISIKTDVEIQKSHVSSIGGAVGGAVLFGPLGAMIGGRAKEKKSKVISSYLIFTYNKNDVIDYISFDITGVSNAYKIVDFYRNIEKAPTKINL